MWYYLANDSGPTGASSQMRSAWSLRFGLSLLLFYSLCAQTQNASEYQVKAAYLYNFAKSAEWPGQTLPSAASPLVIGVVAGDDEFIDSLTKTVAGRSIGTHPMGVKRITTDAELKSCQMVFVRSSAGRKRTQAVVSALASASVLLVGEEDGFLRQGGMINLVLANGTIRFEIDRGALERADIKVSAELLATAERSSANGPTEGSRRLVVSSQPEYPRIAQAMSIKGSVQLELTVARDGTVHDVRVIGGHPILTEACANAVRGWRYEPAAKESRIIVRFAFGQ
jgi:TonB family protein